MAYHALMGAKGRASFEKRQKELARQQRAKDKAAKRTERRQGDKPERKGEVDPDIADIVPGPQPPPY